MGLRRYLLFSLFVLVCASALECRADSLSKPLPGANYWHELRYDVRSALQRLLKKEIKPGSELEYEAWFRNWHCSRKDHDTCKVDTDSLPEFLYNHSSLNQRVSLACVVSKIVTNYPDLLDAATGLKSIEKGGSSAALGFIVGNEELLRQKLIAHGFTSNYGAGLGRAWGLRSPLAGPELHVEKTVGRNWVNIHLDLNNPGKQSDQPEVETADIIGGGELIQTVKHLVVDYYFRGSHYSPAEVLAAMGPDACGMGQTDLLLAAQDAAERMNQIEMASKHFSCVAGCGP